MILEVEDVTAGHGPITVLRDISMSVVPGEILGMLGRNGMGKLMTDPKLMLLDETSDGIMPVLVKQIAEILLAINRNEKMTLMVVEQNLPMLFRMTDRFIILEKAGSSPRGRAHRSPRAT